MLVENVNRSEPAQINVTGIVSAEQIVSGSAQGGLLRSVKIAETNRIRRRSPRFVCSNTVPPEFQSRLNEAFAQKFSVGSTLHLLSLADALIVGQGSVIVSNGEQYHLLSNSAREFLAHRLVPDEIENVGNETFVIRKLVHRTIDDESLLLKRPWSNNFGHWLVDQAMALSYLVHTENLPTRNIVVAKVWSAKLREIMFETISAILPDAIIHEHPDSELWKFKKLHYVMPLHVPPLFKLPAALEFLRADMLAVSKKDMIHPRRLHIVRQGKMRNLDNEPAVIELSAKYGFETVSPENMTLAEQAMLFNGADAILGVKGAAMTNILFAKASCRLMLMSPCTFTDPFFWDIASVLGVAYSEIFGQNLTERDSLGHNDFVVNLNDVEQMITTTLAAPPGLPGWLLL